MDPRTWLPLSLLCVWLAGSLRAGPPVTFTDITASSGITFRHAASKTSVKFLPETMGGGVALFDADNRDRACEAE